MMVNMAPVARLSICARKAMKPAYLSLMLCKFRTPADSVSAADLQYKYALALRLPCSLSARQHSVLISASLRSISYSICDSDVSHKYGEAVEIEADHPTNLFDIEFLRCLCKPPSTEKADVVGHLCAAR